MYSCYERLYAILKSISVTKFMNCQLKDSVLLVHSTPYDYSFTGVTGLVVIGGLDWYKSFFGGGGDGPAGLMVLLSFPPSMMILASS